MIVWSVLARQDLRFIHQYIANDSKRYADRVIQDIVEKVEILFAQLCCPKGEGQGLSLMNPDCMEATNPCPQGEFAILGRWILASLPK